MEEIKIYSTIQKFGVIKFFKEINTFIQQWYIKLIKSGSKYHY